MSTPQNSSEIDLEKAALHAADIQAALYRSPITEEFEFENVTGIPLPEPPRVSTTINMVAICMGCVASMSLLKTIIAILEQADGVIGLWHQLMALTGDVTITFQNDAAFQLAVLLLSLLFSAFIVVTYTLGCLIFGLSD